MKLETVAIAELIPDPNNARKHDAVNLQAIAGSLEKFGQRKPIVISAKNIIVAGNGTVEAAKSLGWEKIQAVRTPADWTADQIKAFALADNRTAELATWDTEVMNKQLAELEEAGFDVATFGFQTPEIPLLDVETFEDEAPEPPEEPRTKPGDVWKLGDHRLVCGDATNADDLRKALAGELADCVLTDPPYNVDYQGGTKDKLKIENDHMDDGAFRDFIRKSYAALIENTKPGGAIYVCHADSNGVIFRSQMEETGWLLKQCLIWAKDSLVLGRQDYHWQHEPILYGWKPGAGHNWYGTYKNTTIVDFGQQDLTKKSKAELVEFLAAMFETSTVIREKRPRRSDVHPTMKPIGLISRLLKNSMARGQVVLDSFGGSGSTLIAAEQLGLRCAMVELDPKYCDVIIERWQNLTGGVAELEV